MPGLLWLTNALTIHLVVMETVQPTQLRLLARMTAIPTRRNAPQEESINFVATTMLTLV